MVHSNGIKSEVKTITVLGTGIIGAPVAANLQKHKFEVRAWNRTRSKAEKLQSVGVTVFETPLEAVQDTDVIISLLKDGPVVLEVMQSVKESLSKGTIWIQMSTVGTNIDELASFANQHELIFYDAPVQGTKQPAEQGQLIILVSGPTQYRERMEPIFEAIGKRTVWVSEKPGTSSRLKLALNSWVFALTHGVAESLTIAKELGVDPALVVDVVTGGPMDNTYFQQKAKAILTDDYTTSFSVANAVKDAQLVVTAMEKEAIQVDITRAGLQRFQRAVDKGHGDKDMAASGLVGEKGE
ncbi:NAD(P)-dependent oxidoreductase [Lysinibacillus xylanilyticus]|uniref:NAD(P)-dependent oxidoreductase n=1 Tax=Lysinibacillus xylanilyticus TaxID=582475 RepID=A0ABT4EJ77_9BACI|nr:NAD(P)-dependent oxidoreductase [Lysinibacillus xylanilyticus]MCY9545695.1 NAD(P)-dependent oxidoreductase [Lysinibacillus xylanilyticus]MED3800833.1 NAD(P)-dependent oxidoreductase [Lysinibacillus xylanilyticus]